MTSWRRVRLDWIVDEERYTAQPSNLGVPRVFHYSIPTLDEYGDGQMERVSDIGSGKLLLQGGEVLISKLNPRKPRVVVAQAHGVPTVASTEFIAVRPRAELDPRFLVYMLLSETTTQYLNGAVQSVTRSQQRVDPDVLTKMWVTIPDPEWQVKVANFLDAETARIDAGISKRRTALSLLGSRREASIFAGVSGSLTSGEASVAVAVPWLPTVPASWRTVLLKLVARLGSGHTPSRSHPEWWVPDECSIPWITTGEVAQLRSDRLEVIADTRERLSPAGLANSAAELHPRGTVVLSRTASVGFSAIMGAAMATSQDFATWTCGPLLRPRFLLLCLRAMRRDLLYRLAMGSTHKTIYMPDIESIRIPLPSLSEQDRIVEAVQRRLARIELVEDGIRRQINLLREQRQALITAAVVGQADVSGGVA